MPILVDSGFRRGSDIVKALCMGATAVCVGRPYHLGARRLRPAWRRARARVAAHRDPRHDPADGRAERQAAGSSDGAAGLSEATTGLRQEGSRQREPSTSFLSETRSDFHACNPCRRSLDRPLCLLLAAAQSAAKSTIALTNATVIDGTRRAAASRRHHRHGERPHPRHRPAGMRGAGRRDRRRSRRQVRHARHHQRPRPCRAATATRSCGNTRSTA